MSAEVKTPEQIASDIITALDLGEGTEGRIKQPGDLTDAYRSGWLDGDSIPDMLAEAVRTDRAQRVPAYCRCINPEDGCDCKPPLPGKIAKRAARGVKARWLRMGYTKGEASDVADEAKAAAMRALKEVGL